jgi:large conductance mechanosensitive channel
VEGGGSAGAKCGASAAAWRASAAARCAAGRLDIVDTSSSGPGDAMLKTLQGFKDFIMRGNVVDLAVGIVIGASFTALVGAFTSAFIEPTLQLVGADSNKVGGAWMVGSVAFSWSAFVNGLITFVITAAVLYFLVVLPMNKLAVRRKKGEEPEPKAPSEEVILLMEIRDVLVNGSLPSQRRADAARSDAT